MIFESSALKDVIAAERSCRKLPRSKSEMEVVTGETHCLGKSDCNVKQLPELAAGEKVMVSLSSERHDSF